MPGQRSNAAVVTIAALITMSRPMVIAVAVAWLAWAVPHLVYHLRHLDVFSSTDDKVLNVVALSVLPSPSSGSSPVTYHFTCASSRASRSSTTSR